MADFRRWILALAMLALVLGSVAPASAQVVGPQIACNASASVTPTLRHEGFTELTGDILLTCTAVNGSKPVPIGTPVPQANISVSLNAPITSRVYGSYVVNTPTDALILVDDPSPANQTVCGSPTNGILCQVTFPPGSDIGTFNQAGIYNTFQGILGGPTQPVAPFYSVTFLGVPVDPPLTSRTYRITNIRIDASGLPAGTVAVSPVTANVSSSSSTSIQINTPLNIVGYVANSLTVSTSPLVPNFLQCQTYDPVDVGSINFTETFASAFKMQGAEGQNTPGQVYYTESGLEVGLPAVDETSGVADAPTQFYATISNIPPGVSIWVQDYAVSPASAPNQLSDATLVSGSTGGSIECVGNGDYDCDQVIDGTQSSPTSITVVWAITNTNSAAIDSLTFEIDASAVGTPGQPLVTPTTVTGWYYPTDTVWSVDDNIPTFNSNVNPYTPQTLFTESLCQTILLFPWITDVTGFDTGFAISNTSLDSPALGTLGASPQTGGCTVYFYSGGALADSIFTNGAVPGQWSSTDYVNSPAGCTTDCVVPEINVGTANAGLVMPGQSWSFTLGTTDPNFPTGVGASGYAIAVCNFQYAHGYAFVGDAGIRNFATAYLALVIPDTARTPQPFICSAQGCSSYTQPGEQLVH